MKTRIFALCLTVLLCLGLCGCEWKNSTITKTENGTVDDAVLYGHGMELAGLLEEMVNSDAYLEMMGGSTEILSVLEPIRGKSFAEPKCVYQIRFTEEAAVDLLRSAAEVDLDGFSQPLRQFLLHRTQNSFATILNSQAGARVLAASSICTVSQTYMGEALDENSILIYLFPEACPVAVSFFDNGNGCVDASAVLLLNADLTEDSVEAVDALLQSLGLSGVQIEKLDKPKNS